MTKHRRGSRGFTLAEMLTATAIIGLMLVLLGYEFDHALEHLLHTRSNRDMESTARLTMSKVTNSLRTASPWVFVTPGPPPTPDPNQVIVNPLPVATPGATATAISFYRVQPGSLADPAKIGTDATGAPSLAYDLVTIQRSTNPCNPGCADPSPDYLVESAINEATGSPEVPIVLGKDVTDFQVTAIGSKEAAQVNVTLTVGADSSRCDPDCTYTTSSSVYVGGGNSQ